MGTGEAGWRGGVPNAQPVFGGEQGSQRTPSSCWGYAVSPSVQIRGDNVTAAMETQPVWLVGAHWALLWCQPPARFSSAPATECSASKCQSAAGNPSGLPTTGASFTSSPSNAHRTDRHQTHTQSLLNHSQTSLSSHTNYWLLTASPVRRQKTLFFLDENWLVILQKDP